MSGLIVTPDCQRGAEAPFHPTGVPVGTPKYSVRESLRWIPFDS